jgi:hypothetical protein
MRVTKANSGSQLACPGKPVRFPRKLPPNSPQGAGSRL